MSIWNHELFAFLADLMSQCSLCNYNCNLCSICMYVCLCHMVQATVIVHMCQNLQKCAFVTWVCTSKSILCIPTIFIFHINAHNFGNITVTQCIGLWNLNHSFKYFPFSRHICSFYMYFFTCVSIPHDCSLFYIFVLDPSNFKPMCICILCAYTLIL